MSKTALVPIADGIEEIEAVCIIDTLRRAGVTVTVASVGDLHITASRGTRITADVAINRCADLTYDLIALPGGMPGAQNLAQSRILVDLLVRHRRAGQWIAAICAAPAVVLQAHGLLEGIKATCYPSFQDRLQSSLLSKERVVVDRNTVTGQGPGAALEFALALVEQLAGRSKREDVAKAMIVAS